jgi:hypothetical protein
MADGSTSFDSAGPQIANALYVTATAKVADVDSAVRGLFRNRHAVAAARS